MPVDEQTPIEIRGWSAERLIRRGKKMVRTFGWLSFYRFVLTLIGVSKRILTRDGLSHVIDVTCFPLHSLCASAAARR